MDNRNLFVYGTLRRCFRNEFARLLRRSARFVGYGKVKGRLYLIADYPGLVATAHEDWVHGEIYRLNTPAETYKLLDDYEGCGPTAALPHEYRRAVWPVLIDTGEWIRACVYTYEGEVSGKERITSGDFSPSLISSRKSAGPDRE